MSHPRFFVDAVAPQGEGESGTHRVALSSLDYHHMVNVARTRVGEPVELVVRGSWDAYSARVAVVGNDAVHVTDVEPIAVNLSPFDVHLLFGLAKGERSDTIIRQAVEVGVRSLVPALFTRSVVKLAGDKVRSRGDRLRKVAESAAKQSHRAIIPPVADPAPLTAALDSIPAETQLIVLWEEASGSLVEVIDRVVEGGTRAVALVVGPEGGITPEEVAMLRQRGAVVTGLGSTILRVDTACTVACAVALHTAEHVIAQLPPPEEPSGAQRA